MATKSGLNYNGYNLPVGAVINIFGKVVPSGFLVCDGTTKNIAEYPELFRILDGIGYGQTATQFDLPDLVNYFIMGANVNANIIDNGTAGSMSCDYTLTSDNIPPLTTDSQNAITFNCSTDLHAIITSNGFSDNIGGSPTETFLKSSTGFHPAGSVSVNLSAETASYFGTNTPQSIPASSVPVPDCYLMRYCIRADYNL